jgi:3-hydroxybutyrate dehydrogenase/3-oxoacyl-[acyl-carrier protein] reductase
MELDLRGRTAVVTGGTRGIGRGIADLFHESGASVVINGRSEEKGKQAIEEMGGGDRVEFIAGDVTSKADVEQLIDGAVERFGHLDILVNNAGGIAGWGLVGDMTDEAWLRTIDMNLNSVFYATRRALRHMVPRSSGRIINISSVEGKQASKAGVGNYVTTKHALHGLTKAVAFEYGPVGITCNAICPGAVETDMMMTGGPEAARSAGITYEQFLENFANESMLKRLNTSEEVAAMALLLASDHGSGITGALLNVDGGTASW